MIIKQAAAIFTPTGDIFAVINDPELSAPNAAKPPIEITRKRKMLCRLIFINAGDFNRYFKFSQPKIKIIKVGAINHGISPVGRAANTGIAGISRRLKFIGEISVFEPKKIPAPKM